MTGRVFQPLGTLALQPQAFGFLFDLPARRPPTSMHGDVAVIPIRGPLMHHVDPFFDSYDEIKLRLASAIGDGAKTVVLAIDSPGGLVAGCFETSATLREMAVAARVKLVAYVDGCAASAAYALACAASEIYAPPAACIGSIGVIDALVDATKQNEKAGISVRLIASGARKTDGYADAPITDDAVRASQAHVDALASVFFDVVAAARDTTPEKIRQLEAAVMHGPDAVAHGLADEVMTFDQLLAKLAGAEEGSEMEELEQVVELLRKIADGDNAEAAAIAKRMLDAYEEKAEEVADEVSDDLAEKGDDEEASKGDDDEDDAPKASTKSTAKASSSDAGLEALAEIHKLKAALAKRDADQERSTLLASRPDFDAKLVAALRKAPLATVREMVKALPRSARTKAAAAAATVPATRGDTQGSSGASQLPPEEKLALDRRMGLASSRPGIEHKGNRMILGALPAAGKDA